MATMDKTVQPKRTRAYVDEAFQQLVQHPGVTDIIVLNKEGNPIKTTMERQMAIEYAGLYETLMQKVQYMIQQIDSNDEVLSFRVRTKFDETLVTPDGKVSFIVVQNVKDLFES